MRYLIKTKGTASIPDYLQIRDDSFRLVAHCVASRFQRTFDKLKINIDEDKARDIIENLPYGRLIPIEE